MSSITSFCITKCQYATWYSHQQGTFGYAIQPYLKSANIQIQYIDCLIRIIYQLIYKYIIQDTRQYIVLHHPHDFLPHLFPAIFSFPKFNKLTRQVGHRSNWEPRSSRLPTWSDQVGRKYAHPEAMGFLHHKTHKWGWRKVIFIGVGGMGEGKVLVAKS